MKRSGIFRWALLPVFLFFVIWALLNTLSSEKPGDAELAEHRLISAVKVPPKDLSTEVPTVVIPESGREVFPLMAAGKETDVEWTSRTPAARRVRRIFPDPALLVPEPVLQKGDVVELALFEDTVFSAEIANVTRYPNGAIGMTAPLQGEAKGVVFLSYCGGELRASVEVPGGDDYYVRYDPETKSHYAVQVDRENSDFLEGGDPLIPLDDAAVSDGPKQALGDEPPEAPADAPLGTTIIDVMIVYTPAARSNEGGTSGMNDNIALAMEKANFAHGNSDTRVYLHLVHSVEVTYTESDEGDDSSTDLTRLKNTSDGYMDEVHDWRDTYGADLVCLFEKISDAGGRGYLLSNTNGSPDWGFCLARVQQTDWTYTVVHEWGHNMGCHHSKTQEVQAGPGLYDYSAGWQWDDTASSYDGYCTVMTYRDFDDDGNTDYTRIGYFSNPSINYTGDTVNATGHADDGDNAQTIRNVRAVIADYRTGPFSTFPHTNSFEAGYNSWRYDEGEIDWDRNSGSTGSPNTGPAIAHDGDYYVYTEASGSQYNKTALLEARFDFSELAAPEIAWKRFFDC